VTDSFNLRGEDSISTGNEQLTLSGTFNTSLSSNRYAVLILTGLSGITQGGIYRLQCNSNASKLKVNF